jgi:two-component system chemotaxis response regulator CheB
MIRVLVVEDSMVARQLLVHILQSDPQIEVVGQASEGQEAIDLSSQLQPDLITMDVQMPGMDGMQATQKIMSTEPRPIVIVSAQDPSDVRTSMASMGAGALAILPKPTGPTDPYFEARARELCNTVKAMSEVRVVKRRAPKPPVDAVPAPPQVETNHSKPSTEQIKAIVVGSSTGGPDALREFLLALNPLPVPVLIVQHISKGFHQGLADWLDGQVQLPVCLAQEGMNLQAGNVFLAPGEGHLTLKPGGKVHIDPAPPVGSHRPSVNMLFSSAARIWGSGAVAVMLTGMGDDGADGTVELHRSGSLILGQDEESCVVYGMPKVIHDRGLVHYQLPPAQIARHINGLFS